MKGSTTPRPNVRISDTGMEIVKFSKGIQVQARNDRGTRYLNYKLLIRKIRWVFEQETMKNWTEAQRYDLIFKDILIRDMSRMDTMYHRDISYIRDLLYILSRDIWNLTCSPSQYKFSSVSIRRVYDMNDVSIMFISSLAKVIGPGIIGISGNDKRVIDWLYNLLECCGKLAKLRSYIIWNSIAVIKVLKKRRCRVSLRRYINNPMDAYALLNPHDFYVGATLEYMNKNLRNLMLKLFKDDMFSEICQKCNKRTCEPIKSICNHILCWKCIVNVDEVLCLDSSLYGNLKLELDSLLQDDHGGDHHQGVGTGIGKNGGGTEINTNGGENGEEDDVITAADIIMIGIGDHTSGTGDGAGSNKDNSNNSSHGNNPPGDGSNKGGMNDGTPPPSSLRALIPSEQNDYETDELANASDQTTVSTSVTSSYSFKRIKNKPFKTCPVCNARWSRNPRSLQFENKFIRLCIQHCLNTSSFSGVSDFDTIFQTSFSNVGFISSDDDTDDEFTIEYAKTELLDPDSTCESNGNCDHQHHPAKSESQTENEDKRVSSTVEDTAGNACISGTVEDTASDLGAKASTGTVTGTVAGTGTVNIITLGHHGGGTVEDTTTTDYNHNTNTSTSNCGGDHKSIAGTDNANTTSIGIGVGNTNVTTTSTTSRGDTEEANASDDALIPTFDHIFESFPLRPNPSATSTMASSNKSSDCSLNYPGGNFSMPSTSVNAGYLNSNPSYRSFSGSNSMEDGANINLGNGTGDALGTGISSSTNSHCNNTCVGADGDASNRMAMNCLGSIASSVSLVPESSRPVGSSKDLGGADRILLPGLGGALGTGLGPGFGPGLGFAGAETRLGTTNGIVSSTSRNDASVACLREGAHLGKGGSKNVKYSDRSAAAALGSSHQQAGGFFREVQNLHGSAVQETSQAHGVGRREYDLISLHHQGRQGGGGHMKNHQRGGGGGGGSYPGFASHHGGGYYHSNNHGHHHHAKPQSQQSFLAKKVQYSEQQNGHYGSSNGGNRNRMTANQGTGSHVQNQSDLNIIHHGQQGQVKNLASEICYYNGGGNASSHHAVQPSMLSSQTDWGFGAIMNHRQSGQQQSTMMMGIGNFENPCSTFGTGCNGTAGVYHNHICNSVFKSQLNKNGGSYSSLRNEYKSVFQSSLQHSQNVMAAAAIGSGKSGSDVWPGSGDHHHPHPHKANGFSHFGRQGHQSHKHQGLTGGLSTTQQQQVFDLLNSYQYHSLAVPGYHPNKGERGLLSTRQNPSSNRTLVLPPCSVELPEDGGRGVATNRSLTSNNNIGCFGLCLDLDHGNLWNDHSNSIVANSSISSLSSSSLSSLSSASSLSSSPLLDSKVLPGGHNGFYICSDAKNLENRSRKGKGRGKGRGRGRGRGKGKTKTEGGHNRPKGSDDHNQTLAGTSDGHSVFSSGDLGNYQRFAQTHNWNPFNSNSLIGDCASISQYLSDNASKNPVALRCNVRDEIISSDSNLLDVFRGLGTGT